MSHLKALGLIEARAYTRRPASRPGSSSRGRRGSSGHGHFDIQAYADYHAGTLADQAYDEQELAMALAGLPSVPPSAAA